ncbi:MAG: caspase family protein [Cyanobacteria bacterium J06623_4]
MAELKFAQSLAVVIGINQYSNRIAPLRTAVADAEAVAATLAEHHGYEVLLLTDAQGQLGPLRSLIQEQLPALVQTGGRLLLYFAGHGIAQDGDDGPAGYLIPQDAMPGDVSSYLPMVDLHDALTALPCRHFLAIFDCCFAGAFRWSSTRDIDFAPDVLHQERFDRFCLDPAWQVITSAAYDQKAMDVLSLRDDRGEIDSGPGQQQAEQHSPFAAALMQGLAGGADISPPAADGKPAGDGVITATELYLYLRDRVEVLTQAQRKRQTPEICSLRNHDKGEYVFLTPGHRLNLPPAPELNRENNPYRGLESFDADHSDLFFGRDQEIEQLLARLDSPHPLTVVLGVSGTGKSSLVKAGLLPRLADRRPDFWVLPVMRPGNRPIKALAQICAELVPESEAKGLVRQLAKDEDALVDIVGRWRQANPDRKLLMVIDQTEELITQATSPREALQFQQLVKRVMAEHWACLWIVATLRLDFEAQFQDEALHGEWMDARFVIPPMSQAQLRDAIEKPAAARVLYFEPHSLVDKLVEDVAQTPGALPLLSFALSEMYLRYLERRSDNRALTEDDYRALGGVVGSLTQRATQEYEELVDEDDAYAHTVKRVMLRMVALEGGALARRRVPLSELVYDMPTENARVQTVLDRLIDARLVVRGQDGVAVDAGSAALGEPYVEPAHDALVRGWDKLLLWKNLEQEGLALQRRLSPAAKEWSKQKDKRQAVGLLWNENPRLGLLKEVMTSEQNWLNQVETAFVDTSVKRKRQNQVRFVGSLFGLIAALSGLSLGLTALSSDLNRSSKRNFADQLAAEAAAMVTKSSPNQATGALLAVRAHTLFKELSDESPEVNQVLRRSLAVLPVNQTFLHTGSVNAIAFSPEGDRFATASNDSSAKIWTATLGDADLLPVDSDTATLAIADTASDTASDVLTLNHEQPVTAIAFSPSGDRVATASKDKTAQIWDANTGESVLTLPHPRPVQLVRFSPSDDSGEAQWLATASGNQARIWSAKTGKPKLTLTLASTEANTIRFSPDGTQIATVRADGKLGGKVSVWAIATGQKILSIKYGTRVRAVTFSPDGGQLAIAVGDAAKIFDIATGETVAALPHDARVADVSFSPDGKQLATASYDETARVWDATTGKALSRFSHEDAVKTVAFNSQGTHLLTTSFNEVAQVWSLDTEAISDTLTHSSLVNAASFSPDGQRVVTASEDETARLWKVTPTASTRLLDHEDVVRGVSFTNDGKWVVTGSSDRTVKVWNAATGEISHTLEHPRGIRTLRVSPDGTRILTTSDDNVARVWELETGDLLQSLAHDDTLLAASFGPDGKQIATAGIDKTARIWDAEGEQIVSLPHDEVVNSVSFNADGSLLATTSDDQTARIWQADTGESVTALTHTDRVYEAVFSPNGQYLATASDNTGADLWDLTTNQRVLDPDQFVFRLNHSDRVNTIRFSADGSRLVTGSQDKTAKVWDVEARAELSAVNHRRSINAVSFNDRGDRLLTASADGSALVWNVETGKAIIGLNHAAGVMAASFSPDGDLIATASRDSSAKVAGTDSEAIAQRVCQRLGRNPSADDWAQFMAPYARNKTRALLSYELVCPDYPVHDSVVKYGQSLAANGSFNSAMDIFRRVLKVASNTDLNPLTEALDLNPRAVAQSFYALYWERRAEQEAIYGNARRAETLRTRARGYAPDAADGEGGAIKTFDQPTAERQTLDNQSFKRGCEAEFCPATEPSNPIVETASVPTEAPPTQRPRTAARRDSQPPAATSTPARDSRSRREVASRSTRPRSSGPPSSGPRASSPRSSNPPPAPASPPPPAPPPEVIAHPAPVSRTEPLPLSFQAPPSTAPPPPAPTVSELFPLASTLASPLVEADLTEADLRTLRELRQWQLFGEVDR